MGKNKHQEMKSRGEHHLGIITDRAQQQREKPEGFGKRNR